MGSALWTYGSTVFFSLSFHLILLLLTLLLFSISLVFYIRGSEQERDRNPLLTTIALGALLALFLLLFLPDVQQIIQNSRVDLLFAALLSLALLVLVLSSLFQYKERTAHWLDHTILALLAVWEILLISSLGEPVLQTLFPSLNNATIQQVLTDILLVLVAFVGISFLRLRVPFSWFDMGMALFFIVSPLLILQFVLGTKALVFMDTMLHKDSNVSNIVLILLTGVSVFLALRYFSLWCYAYKFFLLPLTLCAISLEHFISAHPQLSPQASIPFVSVLTTHPFATSNAMTILIELGILLVFTLIGLSKQGRLILLDRSVLLCIVCFYLFVGMAYPHASLFAQFNLDATLLWLTRLLGSIAFPLIVFLALLYSLQILGFELLLRFFESVLSFGGRCILILCGCIGILTLLAAIPSAEWGRTWAWIVSEVMQGQEKTAPSTMILVYEIFFILVCLCVVLATGRLLFVPTRRSTSTVPVYSIASKGTQARPPNDQRMLVRAFDRLDYLLIIVLILCLFAIMQFMHPTQRSVLFVPVSWVLPNHLSLATGVFCLLGTALLSLFWIGRNSTAPVHRLLNVLLPSACFCLLVACTSIVFSWTQPFFLIVLLVGLIFFITGVFLASSASMV